MAKRCSETTYYLAGAKVPSGSASVTLNGTTQTLVAGRASPGELNIQELSALAQTTEAATLCFTTKYGSVTATVPTAVLVQKKSPTALADLLSRIQEDAGSAAAERLAAHQLAMLSGRGGEGLRNEKAMAKTLAAYLPPGTVANIVLTENPKALNVLSNDQLQQLADHPVCAKLSSVFSDAGYELYLVGGSVRDALSTTKVPDDLDFTTNARPDEIERLLTNLGQLWTAGARFGTIGVQLYGEKVEVTTFRAETYTEDSRKPEVQFSTQLNDDLIRRDFTMNAMALSLAGDSKGKVVDPFGGQEDLANKLLRTPADPATTMEEDPLRILRAARFAAKDPKTTLTPDLIAAMESAGPRLRIVATERKVAELEKIVNAGPAALARALTLTNAAGVTEHLVASLPAGEEQLTHLQQTPGVSPLAVLATATDDAGQRGLTELKISNNARSDVVRRATLARQLAGLDKAPQSTVALLREYTDDEISDALAIAKNYATTDAALNLRAQFYNRALARKPLPVNGDDLIQCGLKGKEIGTALKHVEQLFLNDVTLDKDTALAALADAGLIP